MRSQIWKQMVWYFVCSSNGSCVKHDIFQGEDPTVDPKEPTKEEEDLYSSKVREFLRTYRLIYLLSMKEPYILFIMNISHMRESSLSQRSFI